MNEKLTNRSAGPSGPTGETPIPPAAPDRTVRPSSAPCGSCGAGCVENPGIGYRVSGPKPETRNPNPEPRNPLTAAAGPEQETFATFRNWRLNRAEYAKQWKQRTGGKVMGYFCTYAPEELMYAAGILPVRILGSHEVQDVTEPHIFGMFCPFCRDCLAQGLKGRFDYLDGIMIAQACLHIRQTFTSWQKHVPIDYSYYLPMPHHVQSRHAAPFLTKELEVFQASLESWLGRKIGDQAINDAIEVYNRNRQLLWRVYETRKAEQPPLSGEEAMEMVLAAQMVDKQDHNAALEGVLARLRCGTGFQPVSPTTGETPVPHRPVGVRLMILGSEDDDVEFIHMVESCGATFVIDDHCTGTRYFWNNVAVGGMPASEQACPLERIAERYVKRVPCPTKDWPERTRVRHALELARAYRVQGAIVMQQKFCDPHELDIPALTKALNNAGIKTLFLEFDVTVPIGQFKVRVEAFLEMFREDDLF